MGKRMNIDDCKTARDFDHYINRSGQPVEIRQNGTSHKVYKFPQKGISIPIPQHNGDIPRGTRHSIVKMLIEAIGLVLIALAVNALLGGM